MSKHAAATAAIVTIALGALSTPAQAADGVSLPAGSLIYDTTTTAVNLVTTIVTIVPPVGQVLPPTPLSV
jgi:putative exporter of polyketide antibiotics